jgi:hypothetical protein
VSIIVSNPAERRQLQALLTANQFKTCKLYKNDYTPDANADTGSFVEADFTGYAAVTPTWGTVSTDVEGNAATVSGSIVYTSSTPTAQTVYGYYVVDNAGSLSFCERFSTPRSISSGTGPIDLTILFKLRQIP